ncbi:hypothetical protein PLESTM_001579900 [Pleodorina starrii]|nr:hypothetical protein PLESTM_001579900 [Pleodorina starrii]
MLGPLCGCCAPARVGARARGEQKYLRDGHDAVSSCPFCAISRGADQHRVVFQDERLVVFHNIRPQARVHLLVAPRHHVANTDSLAGPEDARLVEEMERVGGDVLRRLAAAPGNSGGSGGGDSGGGGSTNEFKFGYHVPPWRSVDHLQ